MLGDGFKGPIQYFIEKKEVLFSTKKVTFGKIVCGIKTHKQETHRKRLTIGGNLPKPEYMCIILDIIQLEIIEQYNLREKFNTKRWVYKKL